MDFLAQGSRQSRKRKLLIPHLLRQTTTPSNVEVLQGRSGTTVIRVRIGAKVTESGPR